MSSGNIGYTEGFASPASIKAELGHKYRWLKTGVVYKQINTGVSNNWVEDGAAGPEYLNDLLDVNTTPTYGQSLTWDGLEWINDDVTAIGNTVIVSSLGRATGGLAESISNHYSSLSDARNGASSGDVIVVQPGTYTNPGNLWKDGVSYVFMPGANVNFTGAIFTASANQTCSVYGKGNFTQTGASGSPAFAFEQVGAVGRFEANNIRVYGNVGFQLTTGELDIVANEITMSYRQYLFYFRITTGKFRVKANRIVNENGSGLTIARTFLLREIAVDAEVRIECPHMGLEGTGGNSQLVFNVGAASPGKALFIGNFYDDSTATDFASVWLGVSAKIVGDIHISNGRGALRVTGSLTKEVEVIGNIYNTNTTTNEAIECTGNNSTLIFKGDIFCSYQDSVLLSGTPAQTTLNCNIYNTHDDSTIVKGLINNNAGHNLIIEYCKVHFDAAVPLAGSYSITGTNNNIRLYGAKLLSNIAIDPATIDLTTGATPLNYLNVI
jgi:hypothetical protein